MARVLVIDDHRALAEALAFRLALADDIAHASVVTTDASLPSELEALRPDVVVVDLETGDARGLEMLRYFDQTHPRVRSIALISEGGPDATAGAAAAIRCGARAVLSKVDSADRLLDVIRGVLRGETHVPPPLLTDIIRELTTVDERTEWEARVGRLTARELEVLGLIVGGQDRATIAETLYLSVNTVRTHVKNILAKLEVHSTLEAVGIALRAGIRAPDRSAVA